MNPVSQIPELGIHVSYPDVVGTSALFLAVVCAVVASKRGRSGIGWFFLGLFFQWVALVVLFCLREFPAGRPPYPLGGGTWVPPPPPGQMARSGPPPAAFPSPAASQTPPPFPRGTPVPPAPPLPLDPVAAAEVAGAALAGTGWYYAEGQDTVGPVALAGLRQLLHSGALPRTARVWCVGFAEWARADSVPGLMVFAPM